MENTKILTIEEYPTKHPFSFPVFVQNLVNQESLEEWSEKEVVHPEITNPIEYTLPNNMTSYTAMHAFMMSLRP